MNYFDWAVRFTVENYYPKGRKKSNGQQSIILEVADCGHSHLLDIIFFNLKALVLPVNLSVIFYVVTLRFFVLNSPCS